MSTMMNFSTQPNGSGTANTGYQKQFSIAAPNSTQVQSAIGSCSDFGIDLYSKLNTLRTSFKKKTLYEDVLSEHALAEILQLNVLNSQDTRFYQILSKYQVSFSGDSLDFMIYEHHCLPKVGYQQEYSPEEIKQAFDKALDDMINGSFRMRILQSYQYTHVAFACMQTGMKQNVFRLAVLLTKKSLTIEGLVQCCTGMRSTNGIIIIGKVLNPVQKPCILVANRGLQNQIVVGPNRMGYSPEDGQYRVSIPDEYQGAIMSKILLNSVIEIFMTSNDDQSFMYGQGQDMLSSFTNFSGEIGVSDLIPDSNSPHYQRKFAQRNDSLQAAFNTRDLLAQCGLLKPYQPQQGAPFGVLQPQQLTMNKTLTLNNNQPFKLNMNQTPQINFNRSQTQYVPTLQIVKPTQLQQQPGLINFKMTSSNQENQNPNILKQPQITLKGPSSSMPIKFSLNPPASASTISTNQTFQRSQTAVQPQINFNFVQPPVPSLAPPTSNQPFMLLQQPSTNNPSQINLQAPLSQSLTRAFTIQVPPKITFNGINSAQQSQQSANDISMMNEQQQRNHPVFNELSPIDQQTLQGYLKELQEDLNAEQIQRVTALMLTDPIKFYEYFKIAHEQLQIVQKDAKKATKDNKQKEAEEAKVSKRLTDFDDLTLFFLNIPASLQEGKEERYQELLKDIKECKITSKNLLKKVIIRQPFPINESFSSMLSNARETADLILELRGEEYPCHKVVVTATSEYFKKAIKENEYMNKYQYQVKGPYRQRLIVPEWMDAKALRMFINYSYSGKISHSLDGRQGQVDAVDILNLLKIGNFFYHQYLQEQLIAEAIIPCMNPQNAVLYLKECYYQLEEPQQSPYLGSAGGPVHRKNCTYAWQFLYQYAQFYMQKHLSTLLKASPQLAYELPGVLLRRLIDKSLLYVVDSSSRDLETILQFTADTWTSDKTISTLFKKSQQTMDSCSAFHYQMISQMGEFISQIDPTIDYQCRLIKDDENVLKPVLSNVSPQPSSNDQADKLTGQQNADSTFYNPASLAIKPIGDDNENLDVQDWKPSTNILKSVPNTDQIFDKEPQYQTVIQLDDLSVKASFEKNKGLSVFSKAFDFGRRSWMLKVDLDYENNVSLFLVERGLPLGLKNANNENEIQLGLTVPIKFSSVLAQFEIVDPAFGDHKSYFFYSFAHDQHQVVGHDKLINLSQLQNKTQLKIKVMMKEFLMHSALMWHLSQNFQDLYSKDLKAMETYKKNTWNTAYAYTHALTNKDFYEVLSLRFYTVFQLMQSNYLKCESESTALGFLFHYTRVMNGKQITKASFAYITDFLAQGLRYQYVDTSKILSALRDNEHLRASKIFNARVQEEFLQRAVLPHSHILLQLSQVTSRKCIQDFPRHHYDPSKLSQEGRRKYESKSSPQSKQQQLIQQGSVFVDELMTWLRTSKHAKKDLQESNNNNPSQQQAQSTGDFYVRQEIMKLQALYYEERRKCSDLQVTVSRLEKRNQELERLLGQDDQWKYGVTGAGGVRSLRRSLSNNDLQNRGRQQQAGYYSPPPPKQNRVISNNEILAAANKQSRGAAAAANNSYDQSMFYSLKNSNDSLFNQTARYQQQLGGSTAKADKKLITNQYADISRLLHRIDRLSPKNAAQAAPQKPYIIAPAYRQTNSNENVPYYRQNRGAQKNEEGECLIF